MNKIKTQYIIAPYKEDPEIWTDLVMRFSAYLVRKYDGALMIENCHATIHAGGYGNDSIPIEREAGMIQTLLKLEKIASEKQNELIILTRNDGTVSSGVDGECKLWSDCRKDHWAKGTQFLTKTQAINFIIVGLKIQKKEAWEEYDNTHSFVMDDQERAEARNAKALAIRLNEEIQLLEDLK
tara:strand:- start:514 stop:1059 length:546 start_codon:yes stop_codon:yes gene_type:complete